LLHFLEEPHTLFCVMDGVMTRGGHCTFEHWKVSKTEPCAPTSDVASSPRQNDSVEMVAQKVSIGIGLLLWPVLYAIRAYMKISRKVTVSDGTFASGSACQVISTRSI